MRRLPLRAAAVVATALMASVLSPIGSADAVDPSLPPLWQAYQDDFVFGTFGDWSSDQAKQHYRTSSPANALKLDSQIGRNNTTNASRTAYTAEVARITADTSLTEEQRAAALQKANENVVLAPTDGPGQSETILKAIQAYNASANLPEAEKKVVRAHVLAWHGGQQPNYFFANGFTFDAANPNYASPATMLARLDNYIRLMMEKYAKYDDIIYSWDVVNEPVDDYTGQIRNNADAQVGQWGTVFRRPDLDGDPDARLYAESAWVRQAFASARKWSDANNVDWKLYLNDYQDSNKPYEPKLSQTIKVMKPIYAAGDVDGYGMQGRLAWAAPGIDQIKKQIDLGLTVADEISVSESDIRSDFEPNPDYNPAEPTRRVTEADLSDPRGQWPAYGSCSWTNRAAANGNTFDVCNSPVRRIPAWGTAANDALSSSPDIMRKQADFTADYMDLLLSYGDKMKAYQIDGLSDSATFNRNDGAQLWTGDAARTEKYSFFAVLGAPAREDLREALAVDPGAQAQYTPESWAAYSDVRRAAQAVVGQRIYDLAAVDAVKNATAAVRSSTAALVKPSAGQSRPGVKATLTVLSRPTPAKAGKVAVRLVPVGASAGTVRGGAVVLKTTGPRKVTRVAVVRGGRAVLALPALKAGTYRVNASYSGSADYDALKATTIKNLKIVGRR